MLSFSLISGYLIRIRVRLYSALWIKSQEAAWQLLDFASESKRLDFPFLHATVLRIFSSPAGLFAALILASCLFRRLGNDDNQFEVSMAKSGCEVHRFDPSIKSAHIQEGRRLWYHRLSVDWRDPNPAIAAHRLHSNTKKLGTILNEFGHQKVRWYCDSCCLRSFPRLSPDNIFFFRNTCKAFLLGVSFLPRFSCALITATLILNHKPNTFLLLPFFSLRLADDTGHLCFQSCGSSGHRLGNSTKLLQQHSLQRQKYLYQQSEEK